MSSLKMLWGVVRYEFRMQVHRLALWLTFLGFTLLLLRVALSQLNNISTTFPNASQWQVAAFLTLFTNWLAPLGVGILLADRLPRDRRLKVEELFNTLPGPLRLRLLGKYLGATLATLLPALLTYCAIVLLAAINMHNWMLIPLGLVCYLAVVLPGMVFVSAFSLVCPVFVWVPLYQFLFFGYWFWGNILGAAYGLPTLSGTILTPIGSFVGASFFKISTYGGIQPTPVIDGVFSIIALVGCGIVALIALYQFLRFEQARQ